jgi:hypothetical protein
VLQLLPTGRFQSTSLSTALPAGAVDVASTLATPWQAILDVSDAAVGQLVIELADGTVPLPEAGHEIDDGEYALDLAWPEQLLAVVLDDDEDDGRDAWLAAHGWTVLPPDALAVRAALTTAGEA